MLEALGAELLGQVLRHLQPGDLRSARQAARIFDQASRQHLRGLKPSSCALPTLAAHAVAPTGRASRG